MLCVNASNIDTDREWIAELNAGRAQFEDVSDATALVAFRDRTPSRYWQRWRIFQSPTSRASASPAD